MLYRLLTEDINRDAVINEISSNFDSFSLVPMQGYWKGKAENSLAIEIDTKDAIKLIALAKRIKEINNQEAVLIQQITTESVLIQ